MYLKDFFSSTAIWCIYFYFSIKPAGTSQCRINYIWKVCCTNNN